MVVKGLKAVVESGSLHKWPFIAEIAPLFMVGGAGPQIGSGDFQAV